MWCERFQFFFFFFAFKFSGGDKIGSGIVSLSILDVQRQEIYSSSVFIIQQKF